MRVDPKQPELEIALLVARLARIRRRVADQRLAEYDLSEATAQPLLILAREDQPVGQGVLAEEMGIEGPSLVRLIDLLQAEGLVSRSEHPTDRRVKVLALTALRRTKASESDRILRELSAEIFDDVSRLKLATVVEVLSQVERSTRRSLKKRRAPL